MKYRNKKTGEIIEPTYIDNEEVEWLSFYALNKMTKHAFEKVYEPLPKETTMEQVDKTEDQKVNEDNEADKLVVELNFRADVRMKLEAMEKSIEEMKRKFFENANKQISEKLAKLASNHMNHVKEIENLSSDRSKYIRDSQLTKREQVALSILNGYLAQGKSTKDLDFMGIYHTTDKFLKQSKEGKDK